MKRTTMILCALLCMASRHPDRMICSDLALNGSFNRGDASDRSIYAATPTLNNGAVITAGNRWVSLDGTDDNVSYPDHDAYSATAGGGVDRAMSVCAWVKLTSASAAFRTIVSKLTTTGTQLEWQMLATTTGRGISFTCYHLDGTKAISRAQNTATITSGAWYHVAATYSGNEASSGIAMYLNGVRVDNVSVDTLPYTGMTNGTAPVRVGLHTATSNPLAGDVDDVRIYSRELSAAEVAAIFSSGRE